MGGPGAWFPAAEERGSVSLCEEGTATSIRSEHITALRCGMGRGGGRVLVVKVRLGSRPKRKPQALPALRKGRACCLASSAIVLLGGQAQGCLPGFPAGACMLLKDLWTMPDPWADS